MCGLHGRIGFLLSSQDPNVHQALSEVSHAVAVVQVKQLTVTRQNES